ncbi:MAG: hypothetical protein JSU85_09310 [Candidatus Zixiibacteriota bacterium]|nr:MAG: hypothetical protein JSU85_09310 [candidate division Zixibacteria bacterium]
MTNLKLSRRIPVTCTLLLLVGFGQLASQEAKEETQPCACLTFKIAYDVSSVLEIILRPDQILDAPEKFMDSDRASQLVTMWHKKRGSKAGAKDLQNELHKWAGMSLDERRNNDQFLASQHLLQTEESFASGAVRHLCKYLPADADLTTTIYFTTAWNIDVIHEDRDIVIHIDKGEFDNMLIHELHHRGFDDSYKKHVSGEIPTGLFDRIYFMLQLEGMATYVAYRGRSEFPNGRGWDDYNLLEDSATVIQLAEELVGLLQNAQRMKTDVLAKQSWEVGIRDRAFYVVGAHMAKVIEEALGREALIETIIKSPYSFVELYNGLQAGVVKIPILR